MMSRTAVQWSIRASDVQKSNTLPRLTLPRNRTRLRSRVRSNCVPTPTCCRNPFLRTRVLVADEACPPRRRNATNLRHTSAPSITLYQRRRSGLRSCSRRLQCNCPSNLEPIELADRPSSACGSPKHARAGRQSPVGLQQVARTTDDLSPQRMLSRRIVHQRPSPRFLRARIRIETGHARWRLMRRSARQEGDGAVNLLRRLNVRALRLRRADVE